MISAMFAAALLLADASAAAAAPQASPAEAAEASKAKAEKDKVVCRYEESIGTRFRKKVCTTVREAEDRRVRDRDQLDRVQAMTPGPRS